MEDLQVLLLIKEILIKKCSLVRFNKIRENKATLIRLLQEMEGKKMEVILLLLIKTNLFL